MSTILSLPSETLAEVFLRLNFADVTKIWLCGNLALNWRLSKGQVVRNIAIKIDPPKLPIWPLLLGQFAGLEYFMYDRSRDVEEMSLTARQLLTLPQKLKSLKIFAKHDVAAVQAFFQEYPGHFTNIRSLSLFNFMHLRPLGFTLPSTLEELTLGSWMAPLRGLRLSELPAHLLRLKVNLYTIIGQEEGENPAKFPETLQSLYLCIKKHVHFSHLLPLHLESLTYSCHSETSCTIRDWADLQRLSLKELSLSVCGSFDVQEAIQLPRTLENLVLSGISSDITPEWSIRVLQALPKNLTRLYGVFPDPMPISVIKCLPPTLIWNATESVDPEGLVLMPPKTQSVTLSSNAEISKISGFPPNLQALSASMLNDSVASMLPHTLKRLNIHGRKFCLEETQIRVLPRNLISLSVFTEVGVPVDRMESFKQLPALLTSLKLAKRSKLLPEESLPIPSLESSQWLPRGLTHLELYPLDHFTPSWLDGLPKTLRSMAFECRTLSSSLFTPLADFPALVTFRLRAFQTPNDSWQYCLDHVPPNATSIVFQDSLLADTALTNASFLGLPPCLSRLDIPNSPKLDKTCLAHLPNLQSLNLAGICNPDWVE